MQKDDNGVLVTTIVMITCENDCPHQGDESAAPLRTTCSSNNHYSGPKSAPIINILSQYLAANDFNCYF